MSQIDNEHYKRLIEECDQLIKAGKVGLVSSRISKLNFSKVPREWRRDLAKICRRAVLIHQGLRLLQPIVRNDKSSIAPPSNAELCEYSVLLMANGSVKEAVELLSGVSSNDHPEADLYRGFCELVRWEQKSAAEFFRKFLNSAKDDYSRAIGQVNLASCLIDLQAFDDANHLLSDTISLAGKVGALRLGGNCYELKGQLHFWKQDFATARKQLEQAKKILGTSQTYDQLLIARTEAAMEALEEHSLKPLQSFRKIAITRKHWESVREADLYQLMVSFNQTRFDHLIHGTPMSPYRQRAQMILQSTPSENHFFGGTSNVVLDLSTGKLTSNNDSLNAGKKIHRALAVLLQDFYAPLNVGRLFAELYPDEYFNTESSPLRIRQVIFRLREWFKENDLPADVQEDERTYRFRITGNFAVKVSLGSTAKDSLEVRWQELLSEFGKRGSFSSTEVCRQLNWSRSMFHRVTEWAIKSEVITKNGIGKRTHYNFNDPVQQTSKRAS